MNKNIDTKKYTFFRLLFAELKFSLSPLKFLFGLLGGIIVPVVINFLPLFIAGTDNNSRLIASVIGSISIFIFGRLVVSVREKATIDKNKAAFLFYGRNQVTITKTISEMIVFSAAFVLLFLIGDAANSLHYSTINQTQYFKGMATSYFGFLSIYLFIYTVGKWAISFIPKKGLAYGLAVLLGLIIIAPIWIFNQIEQTSLLRISSSMGGSNPSTSWFATHQKTAAFIPYMNFGLIPGVGIDGSLNDPSDLKQKHYLYFSQLEHEWYGLIPIIYIWVTTIAIWDLQSRAQKNFLAASS